MQKEGERASFTAEDFVLFYEVSTSIHAVLDLDAMLRIILRKIKAAFLVEGASIALHDAERKEFYFIRTVEEERNGDQESMKRMRLPDHLGVAGWVLRKRRPVIIPDASRDIRFFKGLDLQEREIVESFHATATKTRRPRRPLSRYGSGDRAKENFSGPDRPRGFPSTVVATG